MQAVILAGGYGKRLRPLVSDRPKPMANICGKPFLDYQIRFLRKQGIRDILMCVGYMHDEIIKYFRNGEDYSVHIEYSIEEQPLDTGGAIKHVLQLVNENFFLLNGDTIANVNLNSMSNFHKEKNSDITIALVELNNNPRYGHVQIDTDSRILSFSEKNNVLDKSLVNAGIYLINKNSINWKILPDAFSLEKNLFPKLILSKKVFGFKFKDYFIDIGIPTDYMKFESDIRTGDWLI